jgi:hypothetical protein
MFTTAGICFLISGANDSGTGDAVERKGIRNKAGIRKDTTLAGNFIEEPPRFVDTNGLFIDITVTLNSQDVSYS